MKEDREQQQQIQQQVHVIPSHHMRQMQKKIQHPQQQYLVNQLYSIRKESSSMANDQIYKKLTKSFQRIKKLRSQPNGNLLISRQYDYQSNPIRLIIKRGHDLYNMSTKTNMIVKRKIDKMRNKVDRIKNEIDNSQLSLISEVDINKIYSKPTTQSIPQQSSNGNPNNMQGQQFKEKPKSI